MLNPLFIGFIGSIIRRQKKSGSRESYAHIIDRMSHICGEDPPTKLYDESKQKVGLNWLTNGGGF